MAAHTLADLLPTAPASTRRRLGLGVQVLVREAGAELAPGAVMARLAGTGPALDPRTESARTLSTGVLVAAGPDSVKLSLPPVDLRAEGPESLVAHARRARAELADLLRGDLDLQVEPVRVQISVSAGDELLPAIAGEFTRRCALGVALALGLGAGGVQVRPRRHRLEVWGPSAPDDRLAAALTLVAASAMLMEDARWMAEALPQEVLLTMEPAPDRYGNHLGAAAFGADLSLFGRETPVILGGRTVTAQEALEHLWERARPWALRSGLTAARVDSLVQGRLPLAVDPRPDDRDPETVHAPQPAPVDLSARRTARGSEVVPRWLTWDTAVWEVRVEGTMPVLAVVPRDLVPAFLDLLGGNRLDDVIQQVNRRASRRQRLVDLSQATEPGLWHDLNPAALLPLERNGIGQVPLSSRAAPARGPQVPRPHAGAVRRRGSRSRLSAQPGH